jgi:hypothetical protein
MQNILAIAAIDDVVKNRTWLGPSRAAGVALDDRSDGVVRVEHPGADIDVGSILLRVRDDETTIEQACRARGVGIALPARNIETMADYRAVDAVALTMNVVATEAGAVVATPGDDDVLGLFTDHHDAILCGRSGRGEMLEVESNGLIPSGRAGGLVIGRFDREAAGRIRFEPTYQDIGLARRSDHGIGAHANAVWRKNGRKIDWHFLVTVNGGADRATHQFGAPTVVDPRQQQVTIFKTRRLHVSAEAN